MKKLGILLVVAASACNSTPITEGAPGPDELETPAHGFQLKTQGVTIEPGKEIEYCEVFALPSAGEELAVGEIEGAMAPGSHHLIVSTVKPGSELDAALTVGERMECPWGVRQFGEGYEDIFGQQARYRQDALPPGIGRMELGGQKIVLDYHYYNATEKPIVAKVAVNFHTIERSEVTAEAKNDGFYNLTINTPAGESKTFTGECRFNDDVIVHKLIRHTHKWGTDFNAWYAGGDRDGQLAFYSSHFEETEETFDNPVLMHKGEGFRFACTYVNHETHPLAFGNTVQDEMCILFMTWWSATPGKAAPHQECYLTRVDEDGIARAE